MHSFETLVQIAVGEALLRLREREAHLLEALQDGSADILVRNLQALQMQRVIIATGVFSIFEADLQDLLNCEKGFDSAKEVLAATGQSQLAKMLNQYVLAINVLKHGRGRSFEVLAATEDKLPFEVRDPSSNSFDDGDVLKFDPLIKVDDSFVLSCVQLIKHVRIAVSDPSSKVDICKE